MAHGMTRRDFAALGGAGLFALASGRAALGADNKTLRFIVRTDLRVLDPIWTTAYVSRNHGYMIFDTLFALDSKFKPQPQMSKITAARRTSSSGGSPSGRGSNFITARRSAASIASLLYDAGWHAMRSARSSPPRSTR